ncbi:alkaline phosphatase family protein [Halopiger aswanensis]|uniref:Type I phosphodiesterase/nucleotide pyrophosphatase n=1 Tax=Halopiger aswanensis TaxID=148449 RepID=A0A419WRM1_9EURY|nr:alkaline phosphatase family protein [Halopiger aswanensis]RKD98058.1 type I phosphodiesterase/nucleotide pyrophosphatase [Halopiger aswanensis]
MTVVVLGIDALDPDLVDPDEHPSLTLEGHKRINTINSASGEPSTHELWPTIITGLPPKKHGLELEDGVAWENPFLRVGSSIANILVPDEIQTRIGAWLLNNTDQDAFRVESSYYSENGIDTVFDGRDASPIGIPNYVTDPDSEDREHQLRRSLGNLFERDLNTESGHVSSDPEAFYELCMEMAMIRIARVRRALRSQEYELVFGYTSGLDLIGHVAFDRPSMQMAVYEELDQFVSELRGDLTDDDVLILVSDHGLQDGVHTHEAMVATTHPETIEPITGVESVRDGIEYALNDSNHEPTGRQFEQKRSREQSEQVKSQLEDLGYI